MHRPGEILRIRNESRLAKRFSVVHWTTPSAQTMVSFDFPSFIQSKLDLLTPRQFNSVAVWLKCNVRQNDLEDQDKRYRALQAGWIMKDYPTIAPAAQPYFDWLNQHMEAVANNGQFPDMLPPPRPNGGQGPISPCGWMNKHETQLDQMLSILTSLETKQGNYVICPHAPLLKPIIA